MTPRPTHSRSLPLRLGERVVWLLVVAVPLFFWPAAKDAFRLPKLLLAECLALASLVGLAWALRRVERVSWRRLVALPVLQGVVPLVAVATLTLATTLHPLHGREAVTTLWIGAAALVGWSLALPAARLRRLLEWTWLPAAVLSVVAVLQFHGLWEPLEFFRGQATGRLAVTSLAGNPGDLGAYLVLPALLAQAALWSRRRRLLWAASLLLSLYAVVICQSLTPLVALVAGSAVLWASLLPRRRAAAVLGAIAAAAVVAALAVSPLRVRVLEKGREVAAGEWNRVVTGRLDGWRTASWMLARHPLTGVGHGAYLPSFVPARLALMDRGVEFFPGQQTPVFANAHNEVLEVAAEWGVPGLLALAWALWLLGRRAAAIPPARPPQTQGPGRRGARSDRALALASLASLAVLALTYFPLRTALVGYPAILLVSWIFRRGAEEEEAEEASR